jgi:hypothetical protein
VRVRAKKSVLAQLAHDLGAGPSFEARPSARERE